MWTTIKLQHRFINKKNKFDHFLILEYSGARFKDGFKMKDPRELSLTAKNYYILLLLDTPCDNIGLLEILQLAMRSTLKIYFSNLFIYF